MPVWARKSSERPCGPCGKRAVGTPQFRRLRQGRDFYEFSENAELSAQASLCPRRFGVDAIILFYDITTLAVAMGQSFELVAGRGPVPDRPVHTLSDVAKLSERPDPSRYEHVLQTLRLVQEELSGQLPTFVFAGAPFTLATYQIGVGRDLAAVRRFAAENPQAWLNLLEKTARATTDFLATLLSYGAHLYQLFDSWAGSLSAEEYRAWAQPYHRQIFAEVPGPSVLFVKDCPYLDMAATSGARVISLGKFHDIKKLQRNYPQAVFQGNVDHELLVHGSAEEVRKATAACLRAGAGHRHVLNLDHGMAPDADPENFAVFVDQARKP